MPTGEQSGIKLTQMRREIANDRRHEDSTNYNNNWPSPDAEYRVVPAVATLFEPHAISTS